MHTRRARERVRAYSSSSVQPTVRVRVSAVSCTADVSVLRRTARREKKNKNNGNNTQITRWRAEKKKKKKQREVRLQSHVTLCEMLLRKAYTPFVGHSLFSCATISNCRKEITPHARHQRHHSIFVPIQNGRKRNNNNRSSNGNDISSSSTNNVYYCEKEEKPTTTATTRSQSISSIETSHTPCAMRLSVSLCVCAPATTNTWTGARGSAFFSFETILAFWMRDWLDYKYTYIDDGRSIRLYYPTRSKHSKAKWWIGFLLCISIPERFYVHNFIFFYFDYCFCCSYYWWLWHSL